ncbi:MULTISPECIES: 5'/3'-nucleotidase SurE [unclassified Roseofilum]|uniref:5'/3'-nucleotidase SurE n=1 Tax=unclassified Roseofilum TaxID=2620099 RepID=UPI001B1ABBF0|nr:MULTISPECIES: 5'/3'-nucleotidase SurE [unclassified Roseofilum]MBP0007436.1 5'/3'-nucleotidase SurE [Roseofilum sp. Belize Diploria]MBP0032450.1 5'/3'-nucleotidase SurE [Roseofilum sp. Belize BBD 4]
MSFLVTNDDGIDAPGIRALHRALSQVTTDRIMVVAPKHHQSGCGHQVNIRTVIPVERRSDTEVSVDSTPADCVRLGVNYLYDDIHFAISGINAGCNMGSDIYPSGTIGAAREATIHRLPAIALSHFKRSDRELDWERATQWTVRVLENLLAQPPESGTLWSVNFPHLEPDTPDPELVFCSLCTRPLLTEFVKQGDGYLYVGDDINRTSDPGTDVEVCLSGNIAITKLRLWE